jgi:hypothetical protein
VHVDLDLLSMLRDPPSAGREATISTVEEAC